MPQLFYVFDEHTDIVKECLKVGIKPAGDQNTYEYVKGDIKYILLSPHECYSGWTITLMALPYLSYMELIKVIETSKKYDEIVGCIGILLNKYTENFIDYLSKNQTRKIKKIKRIILTDIVNNSPYVSKMIRLIQVCKV